MKLINVIPTNSGSDKKYTAVLCQCKGPTKCLPKDRKKINFGSKGSLTYISGATQEQQKNYLARHSVNENWNAINAGSLSRYILWSAKTLQQGILNFKNKFHC